MIIREANEEDLPEILEVLKASLGQISSKKTEDVWRYKHVDNPFGKSLVLIAIEKDQIIGVRAFMSWKWQLNGKTYNAFRAVDTATHPAHQGKGVFKRLTLTALEIAEKSGGHFIFNTPNNQSKPGYLKMGWKEISKLKVKVIPMHFNFRKNLMQTKFEYENIIFEDELLWVDELIRRKGKILGLISRDYLKWRYEQNPMQSYWVKANNNYYIAGYVKLHNSFSEFRITELILNNVDSAVLKNCKKDIISISKKYNTNFITIAPKSGIKFLFSLSSKIGPTLTFKSLNLTQDEDIAFSSLKNWDYSLGELELF